jgi:hypothetical protein
MYSNWFLFSNLSTFFLSLYQWFSTFFGWWHTFHHKFFCGTPKTRKILKITSINFCFWIKLLGFENCHTFDTHHLASTNKNTYNSHFMKQKWEIVGKSDLKSQRKIFGSAPRRTSRHTGWETLVYIM